MNLALLANNIGLLWVAIELATLITVLMVGIYRTHAALEAAWKYFILVGQVPCLWPLMNRNE
jgi:hydrogenase-4 component F